jgi:Mn-dependent DtxR family transcriptional regulator
MSKKEMAERFGIQRPSLSRELNKMRKDGLLEYDAKTITIKDLNMFLPGYTLNHEKSGF